MRSLSSSWLALRSRFLRHNFLTSKPLRRQRVVASLFCGSGFIYLLVLLLSGLSACGPQDSFSYAKVTGGRHVASKSRGLALQSTLALTTPELKAQGRNFCTATLVAPMVAITAAHCVIDDDRTITRDTLIVGHGSEVASAESVSVAIIATHSGYRPDGLIVDPDLPMHDLALLKLSYSDLGKAKPIALAAETTKLRPGEKLRIAGFGVSRSRQIDDTGRLRQVHMRISRVEKKANLLHLLGPQRNGYAREPDFFGGERPVRMRAGACAGDSGGPAYYEDGDKNASLVGVTSFGTELPLREGERDISVCVGRNGFTDVRSYTRVLRRVTEALKHKSASEGRRLWFDGNGHLQTAE